jgi:hypothetical protein
MHKNIRVWQIYFKPEHTKQLDTAFVPLDNSGHNDESLEFQVFQRLQASGQTNSFTHWGALSWKFAEKTGMNGHALLDAVQEAPGVDVFYINPYPSYEALHASPWLQGEVSHPDFLRVSKAFLSAAGFNEKLCHKLTPSNEYSLCNYFIGTPRFWIKYLDFISKALAKAEELMPDDLRRKMHTADADSKGIHHQSTYLPFIVERLFGVFLRSSEFKGLVARQLPCWLGEMRMDEELAGLREAKQVALMTKSVIVLEDWQRKRKVFFERRYGINWCRRYLEQVMSAEVNF